jgi:hypothetical protein
MALVDLNLFNVSGCPLPPLPLPPNQIEVIQNVISGEAFRSPVEGAVNSVIGAAGDVIGSVANATTINYNDPNAPEPFATYIDENGVERPYQPAQYITEKLEKITDISNDFQEHSYRLSGVLDSDPRNIGEVPGLSGLQGIAQSYNNIKNAIDGGNIGEALVDHYSPFFSSILGPGDELYESVESLIAGDYRNFLNTFPITDGRFDFSDATQEQLQRLVELGQSADDLYQSVQNLIDSDNLSYFTAADYLAQQALGFSVLSMAEDPCFSQKLLGQIAKPDLKGLLNI